MRTWSPLLALAVGAGLFLPAGRADEPKPAPRYEVEVVKDIAYWDGEAADPARNKLDLYLPKGKKDFPVLFFVHGGAWRAGDRKNFERLGRTFASHGIGTVSVGYRLSPKVKHPAHIQDVARAFAWTHQNIARHGGRPDLLFVSGHSAGGHLVALLATDEAYLKAEKLSRKDIRGAIPISGVYVIGAGRMKDVFGEDAEECRKASPLTHVTGGLPPFLVLYAEKDLGNLGRQAQQFNEALKKAKVETQAVEFKGRDHGTIVRRIADDGDPVATAMLNFILKHSRPNAKPEKVRPKP